MIKREFVSGLPDEIPYQASRKVRSLDEAIEELRNAPAEKVALARRRRYDVRGTVASRRRDDRIMGEPDEE